MELTRFFPRLRARRRSPAVIRLPAANAPSVERGTLRRRFAVLAAALAFPAMAAPGDFGAVAGSAQSDSESASQSPAMPFERPGMSFPGSAFFYLAAPAGDALLALPDTDPLGIGPDTEAGLGQIIESGPAARAFAMRGSETDRARALECLAQAVWYEAASESEAGQRAVAQVVLNRVAHRSWPSSVCGVVYQGSERSTGCQFTFTCDGSLRRQPGGATWNRARAIAARALEGSVYAPVGHATHYHTLWVAPQWARSLDTVGTIGAHRFYRNRGNGGDLAAFTVSHSGAEPLVGASPRARWQPQTSPAAYAAPARMAAPRIEYQVPARIETQPADATVGMHGGVGQVKSEYARAGQWKERPAHSPSPPVKTPVPAAAASSENQQN